MASRPRQCIEDNIWAVHWLLCRLYSAEQVMWSLWTSECWRCGKHRVFSSYCYNVTAASDFSVHQHYQRAYRRRNTTNFSRTTTNYTADTGV